MYPVALILVNARCNQVDAKNSYHSVQVLEKLRIELHDPAIPLLGVLLKKAELTDTKGTVLNCCAFLHNHQVKESV